MSRTPQTLPHRFRGPAAAAALVLLALASACSTSPQAKEAKFLSRGAALLEKKDYARALLEFRSASLAMPKDAEPFYQAGMTYLAMGSLANGVASLRKAVELNPQHPQAQLKLAELLATSRNKDLVQQAAGLLETVLSASPDNSEANDALALAEWKLGKTDEAVERLEDTLRKVPARLQTAVELARLKVGQKDLAGAEEVMRQAVASAPQSSAAELALGQLLMVANQPAKAEVELRKAAQLDPKNGLAWLGLAAIQVAGNRMEEAERTYQSLASFPNPNYKPLHALFLYRTGKRDAALAEFEKLAQQAPDDRGARSRLFAAYLAMGKNQPAQDLLAAALKKNPNDADALFERAGVFLRAGNVADGEKDIRAVLRLKPDFAEGHAALATVHKTRNQTPSERQELNEALRINPALYRARSELARSFILANEPKPALDVLNSMPANQKNTLAGVVDRNWALLADGDTKELRAILDRALRVGRYPELVIQDALLRTLQSDLPGARADAEEILKNNPEDLRALRLMIGSYVGQKQPAKAEERLKAQVAAHPQSAPMQNLLGQWYVSAKNFPAARGAFEAAHAADPNLQPAALSLAQIEIIEKHPEVARQRLLGVLAADPGNVAASLMIAEVAEDSGDPEEAIRRYRTALDVDGSNVAALNNLAYVLAATDPEGALKYAQQAAELAPSSAAVADTLGWIYYKKALYDTSVKLLEKSVASEPSPRRQFHLAMCYLKAGKRDLGEKTLQAALRQDPKLPETEKGW